MLIPAFFSPKDGQSRTWILYVVHVSTLAVSLSFVPAVCYLAIFKPRRLEVPERDIVQMGPYLQEGRWTNVGHFFLAMIECPRKLLPGRDYGFLAAFCAYAEERAYNHARACFHWQLV